MNDAIIIFSLENGFWFCFLVNYGSVLSFWKVLVYPCGLCLFYLALLLTCLFACKFYTLTEPTILVHFKTSQTLSNIKLYCIYSHRSYMMHYFNIKIKYNAGYFFLFVFFLHLMLVYGLAALIFVHISLIYSKLHKKSKFIHTVSWVFS